MAVLPGEPTLAIDSNQLPLGASLSLLGPWSPALLTSAGLHRSHPAGQVVFQPWRLLRLLVVGWGRRAGVWGRWCLQFSLL